MGRSRALTFAFVLTAGLIPAVAFAQQPSAKDKQKAGELVKQAITKSQAGDHDAAASLYLDAFKIIPQPLLLSNVGSEYQQGKKPIEALKYFCKYLEADGMNGANSTYVIAQARTMYIELGGITTVKDEDVCKPIVKPPPDPKIVPDPGLGSGSGSGSDIGPDPGPGPVDGGTKTSPLRYVGIGVGVVGAAVFGVGIYYGTQAKSISDEISNHPMSLPWDAMIKAREQEGEDAEKKQIMFMIGGGAALAVGVAMFFIASPKKTPSETTVSVTPVVTPDGMGFAAAGRF